MKNKVIALGLLITSICSCSPDATIEISKDANSENIISLHMTNFGSGSYAKMNLDKEQISKTLETIKDLAKKYKFSKKELSTGWGKYNLFFNFKKEKTLDATFNDSKPYYFSLSGDYVLNSIPYGYDLITTLEKEDFETVKSIMDSNK